MIKGGAWKFEDGSLPVPTAPGLGVELDHEALSRLHALYQECGVDDRDDLAEHDDGLGHEVTEHLVYIEPQTSTAFEFRKHKVTRTGFPISHGRVVTSTACQGRTMPLGVIIDAGCKEDKEEADLDNLWFLSEVAT